MKVHIKQIPPEGAHLEGEEGGDILGLADDGIVPLSPVRYELDVGLSDGGLFATGRLSVEVEMQCVRCLERFPYVAEVDDFALQIPLEGPETVDLTPRIREDIVLTLPAHPHCDWDGTRKCPGAAPLDSEAVPENASAWEALDQLELRKRP